MAVLVCSCGRVAFDEHGDARQSDALPDTITDGELGACTQWGPFAPPVHLPELGALGDDWGPSITADGLEVFFFSGRPPAQGGFDIFSATRPSPSGTFSTPVQRSDVSTIGFDGASFISEDGLTLVITSDGTGSFGLYISTRPNRGASFSTPSLLANVNSGNSEEAPWLSPDGLRLYFASDRSGGGDLFVAERSSVASAFTPPLPITELSTAFIERRITLSTDELEAFITSDAAGNFDIYRSTRTSITAAFSNPVLVPELNSAGDEIGISLQATGETVFYAYNAVATGGNAEIWSATRPCLAR